METHHLLDSPAHAWLTRFSRNSRITHAKGKDVPQRSPPKFTVVDIDHDDIPDPHASRHADYQKIVDDCLEHGQSKQLVCDDQKSGHAVYAGVARAINRREAENQLAATSRKNGDGTVSVFIRNNRPQKAGRKHA